MLAINKVHRRLDTTTLKAKVEQAYGAPVAGMFPLSEDIAQLASEGIFCARHPDHPISVELGKVAEQVLDGSIGWGRQ